MVKGCLTGGCGGLYGDRLVALVFEQCWLYFCSYYIISILLELVMCVIACCSVPVR